MNRSRAELAAQLMKAARGAQLPLALAEDLYCAAAYVSGEDLSLIASDIAAGGAAIAAAVTALDEVECGGTLDEVMPLAVPLAAARGWSLTDGQKSEIAVDRQEGPLEISDTIWAALDMYAARTYVPESEASRARGAGAGQIDND